MKSPSSLSKLLSGVALAAICSACAVNSAQGQAASPDPHIKTGMFGVARGQVARINAVHVGNPDGQPIQVEMAFPNAIGGIAARDRKTIMPGQATFFDVMFDASMVAENRIQLRALVRSVGNPDGKRLEVTVEVFDRDTGKNTVFVGNPDGS
jgi:hypothetical protein